MPTLPSKPEYLTALPAPFAAQVAEYARELDELHPGWRDRKPFGHLTDDALKRVKYLLKRISLLRQGRDWPVMVTASGDGRRFFAHPLMPVGAEKSTDTLSFAQDQVDPDALVKAMSTEEGRELLKKLGVLK